MAFHAGPLRQVLRTKHGSVGRAFSSGVSHLPDQARVVVVGGGIIGSSSAYHLGKRWGSDVLLLEQNSLTAGTTWHAAGLMVTFGSLSETSTEFRKYTKELYSTILEKETAGMKTGFEPIGFIELATSKDRQQEFRRVAEFNRQICGVEVEEISPSEVKRLFPLCETKDLLSGFYVKDDGRVNPVDATAAFAKAARLSGAKIVEGMRVTAVETSPLYGGSSPNGSIIDLDSHRRKKVSGVTVTCPKTGERKTIKCEYVLNAAGMWARQLGQLNGVNIPNQAAEHYYLITDEIPEVVAEGSKWPVIEDPSSYTYIRKEGAGLMLGLFESRAAAWKAGRNESISPDFSFAELEPDWERMSPFVEKAMSLVPKTLETGVAKFFCGPESFTPDLAPVVGEAPEISNYYVAAGLNSIGILTGGGVGRLMADWIVDKDPKCDITGMTIDRLHTYQNTPKYRADRVVESLGMVYKPHYPFLTMETARNVKRSPIHERLVKAGGCFRDVSGWEGVDWFCPDYAAGKTDKQPSLHPHGWGRPLWFENWKSEHETVRNAVGLIDMSFMSKYRVKGRDAGSFLNRLSTSEVAQPSINGKKRNAITYCQWLNPEGKMELDVTIAKLADDDFMVVVTDTCHRHAERWMKKWLEPDERVAIFDVSGAVSHINLQGPNSRQLLQSITSSDLSNEAFPFRSFEKIDVGYCSEVMCSRITYVGELGFELFAPTEFALQVYDTIVEAAEARPELGFKHCGLKALASLRLEKGYRDMRHDMDNCDTILEAGLGFTCDFNKGTKFIGQDAVEKQKAEKKLHRRLVQVLVKDTVPMLFHGEVLYRNGKPVGDVRAGSYGHTLGGPVGIAAVEGGHKDDGSIVDKAYLDAGKWEVGIAGKRYPAEVSLRPMYDPKNEKIKGSVSAGGTGPGAASFGATPRKAQAGA